LGRVATWYRPRYSVTDDSLQMNNELRANYDAEVVLYNNVHFMLCTSMNAWVEEIKEERLYQKRQRKNCILCTISRMG